jgi:hypothetical protein
MHRAAILTCPADFIRHIDCFEPLAEKMRVAIDLSANATFVKKASFDSVSASILAHHFTSIRRPELGWQKDRAGFQPALLPVRVILRSCDALACSHHAADPGSLFCWPLDRW